MDFNGYKFGLEAEYLLCAKKDYRPLWWPDLNFNDLYDILENISLEGIPDLQGLDSEDAHRRILPFVVEGYHIKNDNNVAIGMMPKGVEIRTPICFNIEDTLACFKTLFKRMKGHLEAKGYAPCAISHHPRYYDFNGPRCGRRFDFWKWAMEVMTTYGPDINISFPKPITEKLYGNKKDFEAKLSYYAPALTALSLASPFYKDGLKSSFSHSYLRSIRTFRRSTIAPLLEWHEDENFRIEYKFFEMSDYVQDFRAYFYLCLILTLEDRLAGRALPQEGIYLMGEVAAQGLDSQIVQDILEEFFLCAKGTIKKYGLNPIAIDLMEKRWKLKETPAEKMIKRYMIEKNYTGILRDRSSLKDAPFTPALLSRAFV